LASLESHQAEDIMGRLQEKVAIVTGGAGGIGAATARRFVEEGASVMLVDRSEGPLVDVAQKLGSRAAFTVADVSQEEDVKRYVAETVKRFGGVDVLFDNAGIEGVLKPITDQSVEDWDKVQAVNARGAFLGVKHAAPAILARGGGAIIITSSVAGLVGFPGLSAYVASKHAVAGLAKTAALELGPLGIRVNSIHPGPVNNRMMRSLERMASPADPESAKKQFAEMCALGRYAENEDIANMALFLASPEGAYCNGGAFVVDGGFTAR
jgi:3alpha(or 20beta)-hydroxysteroid dehydrogenase